MIIQLDDIWFLDCDERSVALTERRVIEAKVEGAKGIAPKPENIGKTRDVQHGFYGTIAQASQAYMNKNVASMSGMLTATALIAAWNDAAARVEVACKGIPKRGVEPVPVEEAPAPPPKNLRFMGADGKVIEAPPLLAREPLYSSLPQAAL